MNTSDNISKLKQLTRKVDDPELTHAVMTEIGSRMSELQKKYHQIVSNQMDDHLPSTPGIANLSMGFHRMIGSTMEQETLDQWKEKVRQRCPHVDLDTIIANVTEEIDLIAGEILIHFSQN